MTDGRQREDNDKLARLSLADRLSELADLHRQGVLSDEEFLSATSRVVTDDATPPGDASEPFHSEAEESSPEHGLDDQDDSQQPPSRNGGPWATEVSPTTKPSGVESWDSRTARDSNRRRGRKAWIVTLGCLALLLGSLIFYATRPRSAPPITPQMVADELISRGVSCTGLTQQGPAGQFTCHDGSDILSITTYAGPNPHVNGYPPQAEDIPAVFGLHYFYVAGEHWQVTANDYQNAVDVQRALGGDLLCYACGS
ncbi:MAG: hypothetical protein M3P18_17875 [Actinomycetota bacterium]|nr:hypothetical protein [Actinomycetota bacterium]